jgi:hypothetical protein
VDSLGGNLPNKHMKKQNLLKWIQNSSDANRYDNGSIYSFDAWVGGPAEITISGNINSLNRKKDGVYWASGVLGAELDT